MAIMATLAQGREYTQDYLNSITISQADDRYCLVLGDCQLRNLNITGNFSFYGDVLNITVTNIYINATLIEGLNQTIEDVGNDIWVNELGDFMTGGLNITTSTNINSLAIIPTGDAGESTSLGGALLIRNTDNIGGALTIYSNADSTADSHLLQVRADNADFDRDAVHVFYDGTNDGLNVQNSGTGTANSALVLTSTNDDSSTMEITGTEISKGVIKITHDGNSGDTSASAIAIDLQGDKTAAQGIVIDSTDGGTSGSLLLLRNNNSNNKFQVTRNGTVVIEESIIFETSPLSWILNLRGVRTQSASSFFFDMFNGGKFFWRDSNNQNVMELSQGGIKAYKDINLSEKVLYNASDIHAERYCDPYSSCYNVSDFMGSFIRNDTDANLRNVSIFNLTVIDTIISEYVGKALNLISFGWFNHINALDINTTNLTSIRATIQNLTTPNYIKGEPKKQGFTIIDPHGVYLATSQHFFPVQSELASDISINITRVVCGIENRSLNLNWSLNYADFLSNRTNQVRIFSMNTTGAVCDSEDIEVIVPINKTLYVDFHDQEPLSQVETATATIFYRVVG